MSEQNETLAEIVAEMRIFKCRNLETGELELCNAIANHFADRTEAAVKRERDNAAAMREALCDMVNAAFPVILRHGNSGKETQRLALCADNARAALAAPPRNCDVGTAEEQEKRFRECCGSRCMTKCKVYEKGIALGIVNKNNYYKVGCRFVWEQMPYEEGGAS